MRTRTAVVLLSALALLVAGCGGGEDTSANQSTQPDTTVPTAPTGTEGTTTDDDDDDGGTTTDDDGTTTDDDGTTGDDGEGDVENGRSLFAEHGCGSCHTLAAAWSSGSVGPNLDESRPDSDLVVERVTNGSGAMPSFRDALSEEEIRDVAAFVSESAGD